MLREARHLRLGRLLSSDTCDSMGDIISKGAAFFFLLLLLRLLLFKLNISKFCNTFNDSLVEPLSSARGACRAVKGELSDQSKKAKLRKREKRIA